MSYRTVSYTHLDVYKRQAFVSSVYFDKGGFDLMLGSEVLINQYNACLLYTSRSERGIYSINLYNSLEDIEEDIYGVCVFKHQQWRSKAVSYTHLDVYKRQIY